MLALPHDVTGGPTRSGVFVKDETASPLKPPTKVRVVDGILGAGINLFGGYVGEQGSVGQTHHCPSFAHALVEPHSTVQCFYGVGEVARDHMWIDRRGDAIEVNGCQTTHT